MLPTPEWLLTPSRAVVHRPTVTGIIADLHLGYAAARQASGEAVPALGEEFLLQRVLCLIAAYGLQRLVIAGDLVERGSMGLPAAGRFVDAVRTAGARVVLVPGNHDRGLACLPGLERVEHSLEIDGWHVVHQVEPAERLPCIMGHLHPMIRSAAFVGNVPCFLATPRRLVLPAQSEDASGGNVLGWHDWQQAQCHAIVNEEVLDLGTVATLRQRLTATGRRR